MNFIAIVIVIAFFLLQHNSIAASNNQSLPIVLKANKVDGNQKKNIVNASGDVELRKGENIIFSDKMSYNKNTNFVQASGNVKIIDYEIGNVLADYADVKDDISKGHFDNATLIFNNGAYLKSPSVTKNSKSETVAENGIFSLCPNPEIAKDNQKAEKDIGAIVIKSRHTTLDKETNSVKIKGGTLVLNNFPIFYTPVLTVPLPSSKRKTGFLAPSYVSINKLGFGLVVPYYFNIATNKDLTTTLQFHPGGGNILLNNNYRHLLKNGFYQSNLELANNNIGNKSIDSTGDPNRQNDSIRWHLRTEGEFAFSKYAGLNFDIDNVGDRNYLEDYHNMFINNTLSKAGIDYIKERSYYSLETVRIQEIVNDSSKDNAPFALPIINSYIESAAGSFNQRYSLLSNATVITRTDGLQYRRVSLKPQITANYNLYGNLFEAQANIQSDFYNLENNFKILPKDNNFDNNIFNYRPEAKLSWVLPLAKKVKNGSFLLEPMANIVSSSYDKDFNSIPNEDSQNIELTHSNMFVNDRFVGFDRNESGIRINYGFKSALYSNQGDFNFYLMQGYRKWNEKQDVTLIGFNADQSNIVGRFSYNSKKIFSLAYNFQLNESNYRNDINELNLGFNFNRVKIGSGYILTRQSASNSIQREQFSINGKANLTSKVSGEFNIIHDLISVKTISQTLGLTYNGCCVTYGIYMTKYSPSDFVEPTTSYSIQFVIKNVL